MNYVEAPNLFVKDQAGRSFVYRELGQTTGIPLVLFTHLSATLDNWDPTVIDGLARNFHVIAFDGQGVGLSGGKTPKTIKEMALDGLAFIDALNLEYVSLLGLSMGGMVVQEMILERPALVDRLILVGTGPKGGIGITEVGKITNRALAKSLVTFKDLKHYLFFSPSKNSQQKASQYLARLATRKRNKDKSIGLGSYRNQLKAIHQWGKDPKDPLEQISQPTLIVNGDEDKMVPTENSYDLAQRIPHSKLVIYEDAGHGSLFQYSDEFVAEVTEFLNRK
ncbi:alpha/beta hydrolase [Enterococcus sp. JM4C]|uniref:alpha/beta fold hydrolase n=1 Tax=Candidatus Enterococcus huntleyi TaxID=1857217 RepID=UPI00137B7583|nr:alpha/beta hydrolase [Enterococcus sp. JM4C]KAF1299425.1 alpha/beta hydrolase [Enterococcus sp. JM4C]